MQGILIDALSKTIQVHELPDLVLRPGKDPDGQANWEGIKAALQAKFIEPVRMGAVHLWVDEEGLLAEAPGPFFRIGKPGAFGPIISKRGLLLCYSGGDDQWPQDFHFPLTKVLELVEFLPDGTIFEGLTTREGEVEHPLFGKMASITRVATFVLPNGERIEQ